MERFGDIKLLTDSQTYCALNTLTPYHNKFNNPWSEKALSLALKKEFVTD